MTTDAITVIDSLTQPIYTKLRCPVHLCQFTYSFVETEFTRTSRAVTQKRRDQYLRLSHAAGYHDKK